MSTVEEWVNELKVGPVVSGIVELSVNVMLCVPATYETPFELVPLTVAV